MKVEKRFSSGLSLLASFTGAKLIDHHAIIVNEGRNASMQDYHDRHAERAVSPQDVSRILVLSYIYQLPVGKGRRFGRDWNRAVDTLFGEWQVDGITTFQTGMPLALSTLDTSGSGGVLLRPNNDRKSAQLSGRAQTRLSKYFNTSVFSQPAPFTFGTTGRTLSYVRGPGIANVIQVRLAQGTDTSLSDSARYLVPKRTG